MRGRLVNPLFKKAITGREKVIIKSEFDIQQGFGVNFQFLSDTDL